MFIKIWRMAIFPVRLLEKTPSEKMKSERCHGHDEYANLNPGSGEALVKQVAQDVATGSVQLRANSVKYDRRSIQQASR